MKAFLARLLISLAILGIGVVSLMTRAPRGPFSPVPLPGFRTVATR